MCDFKDSRDPKIQIITCDGDGSVSTPLTFSYNAAMMNTTIRNIILQKQRNNEEFDVIRINNIDSDSLLSIHQFCHCQQEANPQQDEVHKSNEDFLRSIDSSGSLESVLKASIILENQSLTELIKRHADLGEDFATPNRSLKDINSRDTDITIEGTIISVQQNTNTCNEDKNSTDFKFLCEDLINSKNCTDQDTKNYESTTQVDSTENTILYNQADKEISYKKQTTESDLVDNKITDAITSDENNNEDITNIVLLQEKNLQQYYLKEKIVDESQNSNIGADQINADNEDISTINSTNDDIQIHKTNIQTITKNSEKNTYDNINRISIEENNPPTIENEGDIINNLNNNNCNDIQIDGNNPQNINNNKSNNDCESVISTQSVEYHDFISEDDDASFVSATTWSRETEILISQPSTSQYTIQQKQQSIQNQQIWKSPLPETSSDQPVEQPSKYIFYQQYLLNQKYGQIQNIYNDDDIQDDLINLQDELNPNLYKRDLQQQFDSMIVRFASDDICVDEIQVEENNNQIEQDIDQNNQNIVQEEEEQHVQIQNEQEKVDNDVCQQEDYETSQKLSLDILYDTNIEISQQAVYASEQDEVDSVFLKKNKYKLDGFKDQHVLDSLNITFADDVNQLLAFDITDFDIIISFTTIEQSLRAWSKLWKLKFNPKKTQVMVFSKARDNTYYDFLLYLKLKFMDEWIVPTDQIKLLGVLFQRNLRWNAQFYKLIAKNKSKLVILRQFCHIKSGLSFSLMYHLIQQQFLPSIFYAAPIWQAARGVQVLLKKLTQLLRLYALALTQMNRGASTDVLLLYSGLFPPQIYIQREIFRYYYFLKYKKSYSVEFFRKQPISTIVRKTLIETQLHEEFNGGEDLVIGTFKDAITAVCQRLWQSYLDCSSDYDMIIPSQVFKFTKFFKSKKFLLEVSRSHQKLLFQFLSGRYTWDFNLSYHNLCNHNCIFCQHQFDYNHLLRCPDTWMEQLRQFYQVEEYITKFQSQCCEENISGILKFIVEYYQRIYQIKYEG